MEFSELFHGTRCSFSPDGRYLSCVYDHNIDVRFSETLLVANKLNCSDSVQCVKWSSDSSLILSVVGQYSIEIYTARNGNRAAAIHNPYSPLGLVMWAAGSRCIISVEPQLFRLAVWTLDESAGCPGVKQIDGLQPWAEPGVVISPNGQYLAAVMYLLDEPKSTDQNDNNTESQTDTVCFYSTVTWKKIKCLLIRRIGGIAWSPDSDTLAAWAATPSDPVLFISAHSGSIISHWNPESATHWAGVSQLAFSASSQFLAVASKNGQVSLRAINISTKQVHILNYIGWQEETELVFKSQIESTKCDVYCGTGRRNNLSDNIPNTQFRLVKDRPVSISMLHLPSRTKGSQVLWSSGGHFLASLSACAPAVVWIWNVADNFDLQCVIAMENPVQSMMWDPVANTLAVSCGDDGVAVWHSNSKEVQFASVNMYPSIMPFEISHLAWNCNGKSLVASSDQNSTVLVLEPTELE